jgi:hypothetical protein
MTPLSRLEVAAYGLSLAALMALPFTVPYWPGTWDSDHLAVVHILQRFESGGAPFSRYLGAELRLDPYAGYYWLLLGLGKLIPLPLAHALCVSLLIAAVPLSVLFWVSRTAPARVRAAFLVVPLATSRLLFLGVVGYLFGLCFALITLGLVWRLDEEGPARRLRLLAAAGTSLVATFAHPFSPFLVALALAMAWLPWWRRARTYAEGALVLGPSFAFITVAYLRGILEGRAASSIATSASGKLEYRPVVRGLVELFTETLYSLSAWELVLRALPVLALVVGTIATARHVRLRDSSVEAGALRLLLLLLGIYLVGPNLIGHARVGYRLAYLALLVLPLVATLPAWLRGARLAVPLLALTTALAAAQLGVIQQVSARIAQQVEVGAHAPRGATLLPITFGTSGGAANIRPLGRAWKYLVLERDVIGPYLTAAGGSSAFSGSIFRPLRFHQPFSSSHFPNLGETAAGMTQDGAICGQIESSTVESCRDWKELRYRLLARSARTYDRVLVTAPPPELLELLRNELEVDHQKYDVWLFKPKGGSRDAE